MNIAWYIANRLSGGKNAGNARLIVRIAVAGVALSVAVMIISLAIVKGYQIQIRNKITGFSTHIQVTRLDLNNSFETTPIQTDTVNEQIIRSRPGVKHLQRFAIKPGIIRTEGAFEGIVLKGVDQDYDWSFLKQYIKEGEIPNLNDPEENGILISTYTANRLKLHVGEKVTMYFVQNPPRARRFLIKGIYDTGFGEMDKLYVFTGMHHIAKLNNWQTDQVTGYEIEVNDFEKSDDVAASLVNLLPYNMSVKTITALHPELFDWLKLLDMNVVVIIILMIIIACINMITALLILIVERSNMIGILKALGMNNGGVARVFTGMASYLIIVGLALGNLVGLALCYTQQYVGWFKLDPESYYLDRVPIEITTTEIAYINIGCFVVCYLMLLLPARYVSRISPAKSIRFE